MVNSNFNFKNHILPDFSITLEILENFGFVLCLFWLVNYERHWYLLSFTIVDKHFFFIWLFLGILALFLNLKPTGKMWFDINKNKFYHSKPTVSEKSLKLPLQSFLLLACSGKICLIKIFREKFKTSMYVIFQEFSHPAQCVWTLRNTILAKISWKQPIY